MVSGSPQASAAMAFRMSQRERDVKERRKKDVEILAGDAPSAIPEPDVRPTRKAQWDEARGAWVEWDDETQDWTVVASSGEPSALRSDGVPIPLPPAEPEAWSPVDDEGSLDDIE